MIDIKYLRENLADVKKAYEKRGVEFNLDQIIKLDDERKDLQKRVEELHAKQNELAKQKQSSDEAISVKTMLKDLAPQLVEAEESLFNETAILPNISHESVPSAKEGDKVEKEEGEIKKFTFKIKDHEELGKDLDIIDIVRGTKLSGARFSYLKGKGALLEFALINYVIEKLTKKGFTGLIPPVLVKEEAMFGTGFFPAEKNEIYKVNADEDNLYLAGTAEVPLAYYHSNEILIEEELPKKYWGFSTCFRREAGTYGKDTKGIIRSHQFDKIEMFVYAKPEDSWKIFEELYKINEEIFQELELPYRLLNISAGELGAPNAKKIDTEVYIPTQEKYRELTSCSNDTDFQARRLNIKYRTKPAKSDDRGARTSNLKPKTVYVHTLNDTAVAVGRTIVAILENYQNEDGSITIPKVLQKYTGFDKIN